jgi:predicted O-methyltransferase YrrM
MTSEEASKLFLEHSIDVVYIDGDHRYEFVKKDIELWLPKIKRNGIICGHDYNTNSVKKAIRDTIEEIHRNYIDTSWLHFLT